MTQGTRFTKPPPPTSLTSRSGIRKWLPTQRGIIVACLIAAVVAAAFVDGRVERAPVAPALVRTAGAAPAGASSSAWYCPMTFATRSTPTAGSVVVLNPTDVTLSGTFSVLAQNAAAVDVPLNVPARSRVVLYPGQVADAPVAGAVVRFEGGGGAVEMGARTALGEAFSPCATQASTSWFFAEGSTLAGNVLQYGLMNPFLEDAIADVSFVTNDGNPEPDEFQGVVIPGRSFVALNVSDRVRRREWIAADIHVRSGRIVAGSLQTGPMGAGVPGTALTLGAPADDTNWYLPDGAVATGLGDQLTLFNPNQVESEVSVQPLMDRGSVDPFSLHVPARGRIAVNFDRESRIPLPGPENQSVTGRTGYGVSIRATNGVRIVAQRTGTEGPPSSSFGAFSQVAMSSLATRWVVPFSETRDPSDEWVYVANPGSAAANIKVIGVGSGNLTLPSEGVIEPGRRSLIHVDQFAADGSNPGLVIESDQPVVAGRSLVRIPGTGISSTLAVPVR